MPVVDASVVVDWVAPGGNPKLSTIALLELFAENETEVLAPRLLMVEVANALLTGVRAGRWGGPEADRAHAVLRELPVRLVDEPRDLERAWDLARRYDNHPVYDLIYVALAERKRTELVTADAKLRRRLVGIDFVVGPEDVAG